jgi:hypothetical protein
MKVTINQILKRADDLNLEISRYEIYQAIKRGKIKAEKENRKWIVEVWDAEYFLQKEVEKYKRIENIMNNFFFVLKTIGQDLISAFQINHITRKQYEEDKILDSEFIS